MPINNGKVLGTAGQSALGANNIGLLMQLLSLFGNQGIFNEQDFSRLFGKGFNFQQLMRNFLNRQGTLQSGQGNAGGVSNFSGDVIKDGPLPRTNNQFTGGILSGLLGGGQVQELANNFQPAPRAPINNSRITGTLGQLFGAGFSQQMPDQAVNNPIFRATRALEGQRGAGGR